MLFILAAGSALPATELVVRDLQVDAVILPTTFRYQMSSPTRNADGDDRFRSGTGLRLGGRRALSGAGDSFGLVLGADLINDAWTYAGSGSLWGYGAHVSAGLGWAIHDHWTLVCESGLGLGLNRLSLPATGSGPGLTTTGRWLAWDCRLAAGWQVSRRMILRAQCGWMTAKHRERDADGITDTLTPSGLTVGFGLAWRLSNAPQPLR